MRIDPVSSAMAQAAGRTAAPAGVARTPREAAILRLLVQLERASTLQERVLVVDQFLQDMAFAEPSAQIPEAKAAAVRDALLQQAAVRVPHGLVDHINIQEAQIGGRAWEIGAQQREKPADAFADAAADAAWRAAGFSQSMSWSIPPGVAAQPFVPTADDLTDAVLASGAAGRLNFSPTNHDDSSSSNAAFTAGDWSFAVMLPIAAGVAVIFTLLMLWARAG